MIAGIHTYPQRRVRHFESAPVPMVATELVFDHLLGGPPSHVDVVLLCVAAAGAEGFLFGDEVPITIVFRDNSGRAGRDFYTVARNERQIRVHFGAEANMEINDGGAVAQSAISFADWNVKVYAIRYNPE